MVDNQEVANDDEIDKNGQKQIFDRNEEIPYTQMDDFIAEEGEDDTYETNRHKDDFTDEDKGALSGLMD